ncbi:MAG: DUF6065 family protein [Phycisphaerales bacterium]|nr:hypothetical protein [Phycisphaerales bacterium]
MTTKPTITAFAVSDTRGWSIKPASPRREWMDRTEGFAYRCLPLSIANQAGWVVTCPADVSVVWLGSNERNALHINLALGSERFRSSITSHFGFGILTFSLPWLFRTPPGVALLVRGPTNTPKRAIVALDGVVETDWNSATFTMNWRCTEPNHPVSFLEGEPICMIQPIRLDEIESYQLDARPIESDALEHDRFKAFSQSRRAMIDDPNRKPEDWQKHYTKGHHADGAKAESQHKTKLNLSRAPNDARIH